MSQVPIGFARTPEPPYYAVIFTSRLNDGAAEDGYGQLAERMVELALAQPGCLGLESVRDGQGVGITVAYFVDEDSIKAWREHTEHQVAQHHGRSRWYEHYAVRVARVERAYEMPQSAD